MATAKKAYYKHHEKATDSDVQASAKTREIVISTAGRKVIAKMNDGTFIELVRDGFKDAISYSTLAAALTAIGSTPARLNISSAVTLTANATLPATLELNFLRGGSLALAGFTLTVNGTLRAGDWQVFTGSGSVSLSASSVSRVNARWFGVTGDGTTDDAAAAQKAHDAMQSRMILVFPGGLTYKMVGNLTLSKSIIVQAHGATFSFPTNSTNQGVIMTASGAEWYGGEFTGPQSSTYEDTQRGMYIHGADASNYINKVRVVGVDFSSWGGHGIYAQFVEKFIFSRVEVEDVRYSGITCLSVRDGKILTPRVQDIASGEATSSGENAYGIVLSKSNGTEAAQPESHDVLLSNVRVKNVKTWEGVDMHGGYNVTLNGFLIENCRWGIAFGSYINTAGSFRAASYCNITNGTIRNSTSTGVPRTDLGAGIVLNGRFPNSSDNTRGVNNRIAHVTIEGYAPYDTAAVDGLGNKTLAGAGQAGASVIGLTGAIELQYQSGADVDDVIILDSGVVGIRWVSSINTRVNRARIVSLTGDAWVKPSGSFTFGVNPTAGDTFTINGRVYTFRAAASLDTEITIGANLTATLVAAAVVLNADTDGRVSSCTYTSDATHILISADFPGKAFNSTYFVLSASVATPTAMTGGNVADGAVGIHFRELVAEPTGNSGWVTNCEFNVPGQICMGATTDQANVNFRDNVNLSPTDSTLYSFAGSGAGGVQNGAGNIYGLEPQQYTQTIPALVLGDIYTFYIPMPSGASSSFTSPRVVAARNLLGCVLSATCENNYIQVNITNPQMKTITLGSTRFACFVDQLISSHPVVGDRVYSNTSISEFAIPAALVVAGAMQIGPGSASTSASRALRVSGILTGTGTTQWGIQVDITGTSNATVALNAMELKVTGAAATTHAILRGLLITSPVLGGGGGAATNAYGINVGDINVGGTGNWAIFTNAGLVQFGDTCITVASSTSRAGLRLPHGSAPSSPVNGDIWTTTSGLFARINGATVGPYT